MKMEEMSLSGLDNSKLEVRAPPRVPLVLFLVVLFLVVYIVISGIHTKEEFGYSALFLKGDSQLKRPKDLEEER